MKAFVIYYFLLSIVGTLLSGVNAEVECWPYIKPKSSSLFQKVLTVQVINTPKNETQFYLFTRLNQNCFQLLTPSTLSDSYFNSQWPTRIIIHGWMNSAYSSSCKLIKDAYLTKGDYNVIAVNWGDIAQKANYNTASSYVEDVGNIVAEFAQLLHTEKHVPYNDIYLIGHSLGAHIAGVAGNLVPEKFNTIFALDPAEPNFKLSEGGPKVNQSSAQYVESIQTNMGLLGIQYPVGHASFFPNYGKKQRGCNYIGKCSHSRAYKYFAESINSVEGFWGIGCGRMDDITNKKCEDKGERDIMGGEPSTSKIGLYYVPTNKKAPFAKGFVVTVP